MNTNWNTSGLIIEGIPGTGKTTLLQTLQQDARFAGRSYASSFILSEHHTQRVLEKKELTEGLTKADNLGLLESHVAYVELLAERLDAMSWFGKGRTAMQLPFIFERFHVTHACTYPHMSWPDVEDIDERLAALDCRIVMLTMDEPDMEERIIDRRNAGWRRYIGQFGDRQGILDHYHRQQDTFLECCEKSVMETDIVNTSTMSAAAIVDRVLAVTGFGIAGPCGYIGQTVTVTVDRPLGSKHPEYGYSYPVNYGFVPGTVSGDGKELDAYILGPDEPLRTFTGTCIAVIRRRDDDDDKLVIVPAGTAMEDAAIREHTRFQEQYFTSDLLRQ